MKRFGFFLLSIGMCLSCFAGCGQTEDSAMTIDILKVPHHGNYNAKLPALFSAVAMDYAVITCSEKNPAERETGCQVFCTKDGNVRIISTESGIKIQQ